MTLKQIFGKRLKELRKSKKWTQEHLAELINVDTKHVSFLETGRNFPSADLLEKIKCVFDIEYSDLFNFYDNPDKQKNLSRINNLLDGMTAEQVNFVYKFILEFSQL